MAETIKDHTPIEIKPSQPRMSVDFAADEKTVPFFRPLSQKRKNTWIISLFVIIYLVAFAATMFFNDCWENSHGDCALKRLGRFSFQHLSENPLLGPSASALDEMGALRQSFVMKHHKIWRLCTSPWLHAGVVHLVVNLSSMIFVGIHLEQEFGTLRIGIIYVLSAFSGILMAALFLKDRPSVTSSGPLFGLLGAMVSALIRNWKVYSNKLAALVVILFILAINLSLGLLPYVNNFSNIGGFVSGFLLGFVLLFSPQLGRMAQLKGGLFEYDVKGSVKLRQKLDNPVLRIVSLVFFCLLLVGLAVPVLRRVNVNKYCGWCQYIDCVPSSWWSCSDKPTHCQVTHTVIESAHGGGPAWPKKRRNNGKRERGSQKTSVNNGRLTLTCMGSDKFRIYPFADISQTRVEDLCNLMCS